MDTTSEAVTADFRGDVDRSVVVVGTGNTVVFREAPVWRPLAAEPTAIGPNPYIGLNAFTEDDAGRFFGRENLTDRLWERFCAVHEARPGARPLRLLPILGPSGSGKSSVLRAGLIPALDRRPLPDRRQARWTIFRPGVHPLGALAKALAPIAAATPGDTVEGFRTILRHGMESGVADGLRRAVDRLPEIVDKPVYLLIDQFEETYALCDDEAERNAFVATLLDAAADPGGHVSVVLAMRSDFLGATNRHPDLSHAIADEVIVVPVMSEAELRRAITEPAKQDGHPIDSATVELLVTETVNREGTLPLLQFALEKIWNCMAEGVAPGETLRRIGGVGGALASAAQDLYERLDETDRTIARRAFLAMVRLGEGTRDTRRRARLSEIVAHGEDPERVLRVLRHFAGAEGRSRLVTLAADVGDEPTAEVVHEALLEHWTTLREWLDTGREDIRFHRRLGEAAARWDALGRPSGALWRPPDLDLLQQFQARAAADMTATEIGFGRASAAEQEKMAAASRRRLRIAWAAATTMGLLLIAALIGGSLAWFFKLDADTKRQEAFAALSYQQTDAGEPTFGLLIALSAVPECGEKARCEVEHQLQSAVRHAAVRLDQTLLLKNLADHDGSVVHAAFSPDGRRIVTASHDHTARIWDATSGDPIAVLEGHDGSVVHAAFSPDGRRVVTASYDRTARIWDAASGDPIAVLEGHTHPVYHAAYSPDGRRVVTASYDRTARIWDATSGDPIAVLEGHDGSVEHAAFSPDGRRVVTASRDNTARLWDAASGDPIATLEGHTNEVPHAAYSPDGRRIVTASFDGTARIWDADSGDPIAVLEARVGVEHAAFSPDGRRVVTTSFDGTARIWDATSGDPIATLEGHDGSVEHAAFSPDGRRVVTASRDNTARLWDAASGDPIATLEGHTSEVRHAAFSPDGRRVVTASADGTARIWDAASGDPIATLEGHTGPVYHAAFSPDGRRIVTASADGTARIWDATSGDPIAVLEGHTNEVYHAAFSPDGRRIVTASFDGTARIWDATGGDPIATLEGHDGSVEHAAFSPDGRRVVTASADGTARIWDAASGDPIATLEGHESDVNDVGDSGDVYHAAFSPDGRRIVTASADGTARIWDADSGDPIAVLEARVGVYHAAFSPDGRRVVTTSRAGSAAIWDADSGDPIAVLEADSSEGFFHAVFSPDGRRVVTASGTARIWAAASGDPIAVLEGHTSEVVHAAYSPDGRRVVTASYDSTARIWDATSGDPIAVLEGHDSSVERAAFSPDGRRVVTASADGTARIWTPRPRIMGLYLTSGAAMVELAREFKLRDLTGEERRRFGLEEGSLRAVASDGLARTLGFCD